VHQAPELRHLGRQVCFLGSALSPRGTGATPTFCSCLG